MNVGRDVEDVEVAGNSASTSNLHRTKQMSSISFISFDELGLSSRGEGKVDEPGPQ
jgi:hypothetical protein